MISLYNQQRLRLSVQMKKKRLLQSLYKYIHMTKTSRRFIVFYTNENFRKKVRRNFSWAWHGQENHPILEQSRVTASWSENIRFYKYVYTDKVFTLLPRDGTRSRNVPLSHARVVVVFVFLICMRTQRAVYRTVVTGTFLHNTSILYTDTCRYSVVNNCQHVFPLKRVILYAYKYITIIIITSSSREDRSIISRRRPQVLNVIFYYVLWDIFVWNSRRVRPKCVY